MSEEELIETLKAFENNRVEQLEEPARNLFYAIMKIADERDKLNNIIDKAIEYMNEVLECNYHGGNVTFDILVHNTEYILRGSDKE